MKHRTQLFARLVAGLVFTVPAVSAFADPITRTWAGGTAPWFNDSAWNFLVPYNHYTAQNDYLYFNAIIPASGGANPNVATLSNFLAELHLSNLTVGAGSTFAVSGGATFSLNTDAAGFPNGTLNNDGVVSIGDGSAFTIDNNAFGQLGFATFTGTGRVMLAGSLARITATQGPYVTLLNDTNHTIEGYGKLGTSLVGSAEIGNMIFANKGTVNANVTNQALNLGFYQGFGMTNLGTIKASNGGVLNYSGATAVSSIGDLDVARVVQCQQVGAGYNFLLGTISAEDGSNVHLTNLAFSGGTLMGAGTGRVYLDGTNIIDAAYKAGTVNGGTVLAGALLKGNVVVPHGGTLIVSGPIIANGLTVGDAAGGATIKVAASGDVKSPSTGSYWQDDFSNASVVHFADVPDNVITSESGGFGETFAVGSHLTFEGSFTLATGASIEGTLQASHAANPVVLSAPAGHAISVGQAGTLGASNGATLVALPGALANYNAATATLTSGVYVADSGTIRFPGVINTNVADLEFAGSGVMLAGAGNVNVIGGLTVNALGGKITASNGAALNLSTPIVNKGLMFAIQSFFGPGGGGVLHVSSVQNQGAIYSELGGQVIIDDINNTADGVVGADGGDVTVNNALNILNSGLTGGNWFANTSTLSLPTANLFTLDAHVLTSYGGTFVSTDNPAHSLLPDLKTIRPNGHLEVLYGSSVTMNNTLDVQGQLTVVSGTVNAGSLNNLVGNELKGGTYNLATGGRVVVPSGSTIGILSAEVNLGQDFAEASGFFDGDGNALLPGVGMVKGTLHLRNFTTFTTNGPVTNGGSLVVDKFAKLYVGPGGSAAITQTGAGAKTVIDGDVYASHFYLNGGNLSGYLNLHCAFDALGGTTYSPGHSPGVNTFGGDFTLHEGATLLMEIGGTIAGDLDYGYDLINITGNASLGGDLVIHNLPGSYTYYDEFGDPYTIDFDPQLGDSWTLVTFTGQLLDVFENVDAPVFGGNLTYSISYTPHSVVATVTQVVPEPASVGVVIGLCGVGVVGRRRR